MKKYYHLLLIPFLLTSCSKSEEPTPPTVNSSPATIPSEGVVSTPPTVEQEVVPTEPPLIESMSSTLSAETVLYVTQLSYLLDDFDDIYMRMEDTYKLTLEDPENKEVLTDYLTELSYMVDLLQSSADLTPTTDTETEHKTFVAASLVVAEKYIEVENLLEENTSQETSDYIATLEEISTEIRAVTEDFSSSAFALMVALDQGNLAG